ncbi:MAG: hypothetical protein ORO03_08945, partial [Alphaproteobacteria bacterium]|nr:hypothetical protein [Alphaproteobacteria bacterium]
FVEREVLEYNLDLQNWLSAKIERAAENFAALSTQLATGFSAITSNGMQWRRDTMLTQLEEAWGLRGTDFTSSIMELRIIVQTAVLAVVNYEIHEEVNGQQAPLVKCVTAVLALNSRNRNNVEWLHYHESSLPRNAATETSAGA